MKVGMNGMQLLERSEGNTVVSPLSLFTSLSMASLGAKGLTLDEIHRTLHLSPEALSRMGGIIASFQVFESAAIQFAIIQPNHQMFPTLRYTPINKKLFFLIASFHPSQPPNHPTTQPPNHPPPKPQQNLTKIWSVVGGIPDRWQTKPPQTNQLVSVFICLLFHLGPCWVRVGSVLGPFWVL